VYIHTRWAAFQTEEDPSYLSAGTISPGYEQVDGQITILGTFYYALKSPPWILWWKWSGLHRAKTRRSSHKVFDDSVEFRALVTKAQLISILVLATGKGTEVLDSFGDSLDNLLSKKEIQMSTTHTPP
jgi:hypothetical protein